MRTASAGPSILYMHVRLLLLISAGSLLRLLVSAHAETQAVTQLGTSQSTFSQYDEGLFTPMGDLSSLSPNHFVRLDHPAFPKHSVRAKKSNFCDGEVQAYTGYIDVEARHLFFYFFESRCDPDQDDVIYWTNGGPGGSSSIGLFMELGPCRVKGANSTERNPWSWNEHANIFFVDQPVDVGYSYAEYGEAVTNTQEAANDITAFIGIFFEHFPKLKGRALHLAGESYGGRYIPVFASTIYDKNVELAQAGVTPINLTSIMLGNGCTDFSTMMPSYYDAQCADPTFPPILDISSCVRMKQLIPRCQQRYKEGCLDRFDAIECKAAVQFCWVATLGFLDDQNTYDRSRLCGKSQMEHCYPIVKDLHDFLSSNETQDLLGVDPAKRGNFTYQSSNVSKAFNDSVDWFSFPAQYYIAGLLERGVRALVYVGATDFICNWIGNDRMTLALEWTRQDAYRNQPLRPWLVNGGIAGMTRSGGGLTFATIAGAGHFAPYDRPEQSLELVNRWLAGEAL